jgi:D-glycero-D-manno-heptose 1,7-bisphosphate phosphatase
MNKAVFLDRDGVLTNIRYNEKTGENEPPHKTEDLEIFEYVYDSLKLLTDNGYLLFLVSNQPDYAKGKTSLENLKNVHKEFEKRLINYGIHFMEFFYCYHHPDGIIKEYSIKCNCRKPKTFFVDKAVNEYNIDRSVSWFIGDRESDIQCGINSGLKTILISKNNNFGSDFNAENINDSVEIILKNNN